ncbi:MAG: histidinol-phosphate transaminase [Mycobacterium leprae]
MLTSRPAVKAMTPYVPGKPIEEVERELGLTNLVKLNQNENPLGPSPKALQTAVAMATRLQAYPEGSSRRLRERLAELWDLPLDWFFVGNGSDEVFRLLSETYLEPGDKVIVPTPSFSAYAIYAELMGAEWVAVPLQENCMDLMAMARAAAEQNAKLLYLCRPNNPTGTVFSQEAMAAFMAAVPATTLVVLDEAYREFDETPFDSGSLVRQYPNLMVTRTFSKAYGLAGLRLGYGIARPELLAPFYTVRDPFSVNIMAAEAGRAALDDAEHLARTMATNREGKAYLYAQFERLGLTYVPTQANFILFDVRREARAIFNALLLKSVLVRPCGSFGLPTHLRVTVGTPEENRKFVAALEQVLAEG